MKNIFLFLFLFALNVFSQNEYQYSIDIKSFEKDRISVNLICPKIVEEEIIFVIPRVIPGSYSDKKFAQFIKDFSPKDVNGKKLKFKLVDKSHFVISEANKLHSISYQVNDTWDEKSKKKYIFEPGGSNIEKGENIVLNNHAFFGYFENYKDLSFEVNVKKPASFFASTYLETVSKSDEEDILYAKNYFELSDNPVLYCIPDTTSFKISNTTIYVSVYNKNQVSNSKEIAEYMQPLASALESFFGGELPTDEYWFLIYLEDRDNLKKHGGYGALEHHHSSFYYLPENKLKSSFKKMILDISAHEFLHVLTPLNLHSEHIANFNFRDPEMSEHLWLYEGVTEYFSHLVQLQAGLKDDVYFFDEMRGKMTRASKYEAFSMTLMSKNVLDKEYKDLYSNVYTKGALLAFLLDIEIMERTNGKETLKSVLLNLTQKYGPENPFKDEDIINDIIELTSPEVKVFFDKYIIGKEDPDFNESLKTIGYEYKKSNAEQIYYFGDLRLKFDNDKFVFDNANNNAFNVSYGDILLEINDEKVNNDNVETLFKTYFQARETDEEVSIRIMRDGVKLRITKEPLKGIQTTKNYMAAIKDEISEQQTKIKNIWLGKTK